MAENSETLNKYHTGDVVILRWGQRVQIDMIDVRFPEFGDGAIVGYITDGGFFYENEIERLWVRG